MLNLPVSYPEDLITIDLIKRFGRIDCPQELNVLPGRGAAMLPRTACSPMRVRDELVA